tara:strand:- start:2535 stop:3269 length:735 start_codon:yes stop_codon:yes gene_type:complete
MKVIVTSGKYSQILPLFAKQFNKYFSSDVEVVVLSANEVTGLPDNFSHAKIPHTKFWCNDIREFFDSFEDELFLGCMEDHFLHAPVDLGLLAEIITEFEYGDIVKFCSVKPNDWKSHITDCSHFSCKQLERNDRLWYNAPVRQSLLPSIWNTDLFRFILERSTDCNAWEFETRHNMYRLENEVLEFIGDRKVLFAKEQLYPMSDVIRGGEPAMGHWAQEVKDPDDIAVFKDATERVFPDVLWTT